MILEFIEFFREIVLPNSIWSEKEPRNKTFFQEIKNWKTFVNSHVKHFWLPFFFFFVKWNHPSIWGWYCSWENPIWRKNILWRTLNQRCFWCWVKACPIRINGYFDSCCHSIRVLVVGTRVTHQTFSISVADVPQNKKKYVSLPLWVYVNEVNFDVSRSSKTTIFAVL